MDFDLFSLGDVAIQSGQILPEATLAYKTYGSPNADRSNVVLLPTFYTGTHVRNEAFFGPGRAVDPEKHFIISINMFGNGLSSSPTNAPAPADRGNFPVVTLYDNVTCQKKLLEEVFGIEKLLLVYGWSMGGCQTFQWAAQYPEHVEHALPFCASARTSPHNSVFLKGVKAALTADAAFMDGFYDSPPEAGLKAFGRVYAGWAYSQTWYRERLHQTLGLETAEDVLLDWEQDHLNWDANNLLAMLESWLAGDISRNDLYQNDLAKALNSIRAKTTIIACDNDLYFQPADNELEVQHIQDGELRVYESPWGHCVASSNNDPQFHSFLDQAITDLIG